VAYCVLDRGKCHIAADRDLKFPNRLVRGTGGLIYVPSSIGVTIGVWELQSDRRLRLVHTIDSHMTIENLSVNTNGEIYATGFPNLQSTLETMVDPHHKHFPTIVLRIRKLGAKNYTVEKVVEDRDATVLTGGTTTVHDV
jgi:hypothetical protein